MKITDVRIVLHNESKLKAFASIVFDNCFLVRDLKVIDGTNGLFVAMPARKIADGSFKDIVCALNPETRKEIEETILGEYQKALSNPVM